MKETTSEATPVSPRLFTIEEVARMLQVRVSWLYNKTRVDAVPCRRFGRQIRFTAENVDQIIRDGIPS